jgi:hypothetical protein
MQADASVGVMAMAARAGLGCAQFQVFQEDGVPISVARLASAPVRAR